MDIKITGAKTAKDAAHAAGFVFSERDAIVGRPAGLRHSRGYRVNVNGQASHWVECWHTPGGMLCCAVVYE